MFAFLKQKNPYEYSARKVYLTLQKQSRLPHIYQDFLVPDNFEGRFESLCLHVFILFHCTLLEKKKGQAFNQILFDVLFYDIDQTLREMGFGDMGIPKRMKALMLGFNGRMHVYQECVEREDDFKVALARNLFGSNQIDQVTILDGLWQYTINNIAFIKEQGPSQIIETGNIAFKAF